MSYWDDALELLEATRREMTITEIHIELSKAGYCNKHNLTKALRQLYLKSPHIDRNKNKRNYETNGGMEYTYFYVERIEKATF